MATFCFNDGTPHAIANCERYFMGHAVKYQMELQLLLSAGNERPKRCQYRPQNGKRLFDSMIDHKKCNDLD
jgi:hypothetical protein